MERNEENFFIYTNPLFYLYFILLAIKYIVVLFLEYVGVIDWYYVLFKLRGQHENVKDALLQIHKSRKHKLPWIKELAWNKAIKIIEDERNRNTT